MALTDTHKDNQIPITVTNRGLRLACLSPVNVVIHMPLPSMDIFPFRNALRDANLTGRDVAHLSARKRSPPPSTPPSLFSNMYRQLVFSLSLPSVTKASSGP